MREAAGALALSRDVLILDSGADEGKDSGTLARELMAKQIPVFILGSGFPVTTMTTIAGGDSLVYVLSQPAPLYRIELKAKK
jgi:hypothetical protein